MGIVVSSPIQTSPLSLASTIIGFISFSFTIATLVRVFWDELSTLMAAPREIPDYMSNLKQQLYEEKWHLKRAKRLRAERPSMQGGRKEKFTLDKRKDGVPDYSIAIKAMQAAVRHMISQFTEIEQPFLKTSDQEMSRTRRRATEKWDDDIYNTYSDGELSDAERTYSLTEYRKCGLRERFLWARKKKDVEGLQRGITTITTRRMGIQISVMASGMRELGRDIDEFDDRLYNVHQRLSRVVGVRRVD